MASHIIFSHELPKIAPAGVGLPPSLPFRVATNEGGIAIEFDCSTRSHHFTAGPEILGHLDDPTPPTLLLVDGLFEEIEG